MCTVCGCGAGQTRLEGAETAHGHSHHAHDHSHGDGCCGAHGSGCCGGGHHAPHTHGHAHEHSSDHQHSHGHCCGHDHDHDHCHDHDHAHDHSHAHDHDHGHDHGGQNLHYGHGPARAHAPGLSQSRMVQIEQDILSKNDQLARANRQLLDEKGILGLNLVSSPGSGKTTLLVKTIEALKAEIPIQVVEGDQQTSNDAERIRATGVPALQINTGKGCHLDAHMLGQALERLQPPERSLFLIENVGNLVCPAAFDLGEHHKVAILSVTEGEDKPLKYPDMFAAADLLLLSKTDLLPHLEFDLAHAEACARRVNPRLQIIRVSAKNGEGMTDWLNWIRAAWRLRGLAQQVQQNRAEADSDTAQARG